MLQTKFFRIASFLAFACGFSLYFGLSSVQGERHEAFSVNNAPINSWIRTDARYDSLVLEFMGDIKEADIEVGSDGIKRHLKLGEEEKNNSIMVYFPLSDKFRVSGIPQDQKVNIHLYNTEDHPSTLLAGPVYVGDLPIISRAEWGADESVRYDYSSPLDDSPASLSAVDSNCSSEIAQFKDEFTYDHVIKSEAGNMLRWPRQYSKTIKKIVVHHTAEADTSISIPGENKIRSIYYYHANTKKWGDIGYNFLVDQDGKIYEGRAGGDYVVGGHVYCNNIDTIGVSLMGNFMRNEPPKAQLEGLNKLLNALSKKYNINLSSDTVFHNKTAPALLGHRDLRSTACPGDNLYMLLPSFRKYMSVSGLNFSLGSSTSSAPAESFGATLIGKPSIENMSPSGSKTFTLSFQNSGSTVWNKNTWLYAENNNKNLWANSIIVSKDYVASSLKEDAVAPGQIGHFDITLSTGIKGGIHTLEFTPIINGERKMNGATVLFGVKVPDTSLAYEFVSAEAPKNPLYYGQHQTAKVVLKNTGNIAWKRAGEFAVTLVENKDTKQSFSNPKSPGVLAWLDEDKVEPGQNGTFVFDIYSGFDIGNYSLSFLPKIGDETYLDDKGMKFTLVIKKPNYRAQLLFNNSDITFKPGETRTLQIGLRNQSDVDWQENQISLLVTQKNGFKFQEDSFYFPDYTRQGESGMIDITLTAPLQAGSYTTKFQVLANEKKFSSTQWLELPIKVVPAVLEGKVTYISKSQFNLNGGRESVTLRVKNTGNITWYKTGGNAVSLNALNSNSLFKDSKWESSSILAFMDDDTVKSGEVATFYFTVSGKINGTETFILKTKSLGSITGTEFTMSNTGTAVSTVPVSVPQSSLSPSTSGLSRVELLKRKIEQMRKTKSTEQSALQSSVGVIVSPKAINLGLSREEMLKRKASQPVTPIISTPVQTYSLVKPIKILLSLFPESTASIAVPAGYTLSIDGTKTVLGFDSLQFSKVGDKVQVSHNGKSTVGTVVRLEAKEGTQYFTVSNWNRVGSTAKNTKDNMFLENAEIRIDNGKLILINELSMENYLSGVAEIPESEVFEKRKVMAILARSYARHYTETGNVKFPGKPYSGSDSPAVFQKYLGYGFTLRSPNWQQALKDTKDMVITYKGEILRTSYFSCSAGRTRTPAEAGWKNTYFTKTKEVFEVVDDSLGKDMDRYNKGQCGHGVGLSGLGARGLANQGKTYEEIIHYYYHHVDIEKK